MKHDSVLTASQNLQSLTVTYFLRIVTFLVIMNYWKSVSNIAWTIKSNVLWNVAQIQTVSQIAIELMPAVLLIALAMKTVQMDAMAVQTVFAKVRVQ